MECRELIARLLDLRLSESDEASGRDLTEHLARCAACREEASRLERTWERLGEDPEAPLTEEFRQRALALIEEEMLRRRIREFQPRPRARRWLAQAAAVLVAAAVGYLAARPWRAPAAVASAPAIAPATVDLSAQPRLSNVSYRSAEPGGIEVAFDVTSRQTVSGRPEDPHVAKLLAYLLASNAETAGEKSRAIELVSEHYGAKLAPASPDIVRSLTATLRRDPNPGVRKKAAEALAGFRPTPEIRSAFLEALGKDVNPAVRLVAVDALAMAAREAPDPQTIESLREKAFDPTENGFVRAKAASALKAIDL